MPQARDRVGERHPGAAVDVAHRMQVPAVDRHPAAHVLVGDLGQLDAEVAGERAGEPLDAQLRCDRLVGLAHLHRPLAGGGTYPTRAMATIAS